MVTGEDIAQIALSWEGTPFHHQARVKGVGVDCIGLIVGVAREAGFTVTDQYNYSRYPDGVTLQAELNSQLDKTESVQVGGILLFAAPRLPRHVGIYLGNQQFIHATIEVGKCVITPFEKYWRKVLVGQFKYKGVQ